ncbi:MAG: hypothetical protein IPK58_25110 [Acidobacteria bacterium]|nr:hypothetical protein [Acidobacteriota bacterium]
MQIASRSIQVSSTTLVYVDSFFKDGMDYEDAVPGGITQMTETYLMNIIFGNENENVHQGLRDLGNLHVVGDAILFKEGIQQQSDSVEARQMKRKIIFTLKNYVVYLMYRSNGTPKKLAGLTEQLIVTGRKFPRRNKALLRAQSGLAHIVGRRSFDDRLVSTFVSALRIRHAIRNRSDG